MTSRRPFEGEVGVPVVREACDPLTPPERLAELGRLRDEALLQALASNPSTPEETLRRLLPRFPVAVMSNAAWPLLALVDPLLAEEGDRLLAPLTRNRGEMQRLASNPAMHRALVRNPALPVELLVELSETQDYVVSREVALHRNASFSLLATLARRGKDAALERLLAHKEGDSFLPGLELHPSDVIREIVVRHPSAKPAALIVLAGDRSYKIRGLVAEHPAAPPEALAEVYRSAHDERTRHLLASHPSTPPEVLLAIARREPPATPALFRRLAANPSAPEELLALLAGHPSKIVRDALAARLKGRELRAPRLPGCITRPRKTTPIR